jgi:hypothetical protein
VSPYVHGNWPPSGLNDLSPASTNRDTPNIVRIDVSDPCSSPFFFFLIDASGTTITGLVEPQTVFSLTRADLMLVGLWQFEAHSIGGPGSCNDPTCSNAPVDFIVTSEGVTPTG